MKLEHQNIDNDFGISYFAITATGDRSNNEDCYGHARDGEVINFIVSDGVGGSRGGVLASKMVVESSRMAPLTIEPEDLKKRFQLTSDLIKNQQSASSEYSNMGATVAEVRIHCSQQRAVWGHWGDSRVYWFRGAEIMEVTNDHSVVQSFVNAGLISANDAMHHPKKNILMGAFGVEGSVENEVKAQPVYLAQGDAFLLCTDGFWGLVPESKMIDSLKEASSVEVWIKSMEKCIVAGTSANKDNYTAIGVWITSPSDKTIQFM